MGLKDIRSRVINCLINGQIQHDIDRSGNINEKNLLLTGAIQIKDVIELLNKTKGFEFETVRHHFIDNLDVHIFRPYGWYIKCYFLEPDIFFISVHIS